MKRNIKIVLISLLAMHLFSCEDIKEENTTTDTLDTITVDGVMLGAYSALRLDNVFEAEGYPTIWGDIGVDIIDIPLFSPSTDLGRNTITPLNVDALEMWRAHYNALNRINTSIELFEKFLSDGSDRLKSNSNDIDSSYEYHVAQSRFLRAIVLFNLVKAYESPVLLLDDGFKNDINDLNLDNRKTNSSPTVVYKAIEDDLLYAIEYLDNAVIGQSSIASKQAAQALLGKVYLQAAGILANNVIIPEVGFSFSKENGLSNANSTNTYSATELYTKANTLFDTVINEGGYSLMENYGDIFSPDFESANTEMIFSVGFQTTGNNEGSRFGDYMGVNGNPPYGGFGERILQYEYIMSYLDKNLYYGIPYQKDENGNNLLDSEMNPIPDDAFGQLYNDGVNYTTHFTALNKFPLPISDQRFLINVSTFAVGRVNNADGDLTQLQKNGNPGTLRPYKWRKDISPGSDIVTNVDDRDFDFPYLRLADVYLMKAEAMLGANLGSTQNILEYVNKVRRRAFLVDPELQGQLTSATETNLNVDPLLHNAENLETDSNTGKRFQQTIKSTSGLEIDLSDTKISSKEEILAAILRERRKELCYEGHRKDDLIRNGLLNTVVTQIGRFTPSIYSATPSQYDGAVYPNNANSLNGQLPGDGFAEHMYRFPIPQREIDFNPNLNQNIGY